MRQTAADEIEDKEQSIPFIALFVSGGDRLATREHGQLMGLSLGLQQVLHYSSHSSTYSIFQGGSLVSVVRNMGSRASLSGLESQL